MNTRPMNAEQIRRMSDKDLSDYLAACESRGESGLLYQLACDEEIAREERQPARPIHKEDVKWC